MSVHTSEGFVTAGHKLVFLANFKILQQFPETDCLILPDFSPDSVKGLFRVMYDPSHRFYLCLWCILKFETVVWIWDYKSTNKWRVYRTSWECKHIQWVSLQVDHDDSLQPAEFVVSSDRSSYSDSVLLLVRQGNFFRFWAFMPILQ